MIRSRVPTRAAALAVVAAMREAARSADGSPPESPEEMQRRIDRARREMPPWAPTTEELYDLRNSLSQMLLVVEQRLERMLTER